MVRIEHTEGTDVLRAGGQKGAESFFGSGHQRGGLAPGLVPGSGLAGFDGLAWPVARRGLDTVQRRDHLHAQGHVRPRGDHELPRNLSGYGLGLGIATDPHAATLGTELVAHREIRCAGAQFDGIAPSGSPFLHLEQPGKVCVDLEGEDDAGCFSPKVAYHDVLAHAVSHISVTHYEKRAIGGSGPRRSSGDERAGIGCWTLRT